MKIVLMCDGLFVARIRLVKLNKALALRCEAQVFWLALCIPKASVRLDGQVLIPPRACEAQMLASGNSKKLSHEPRR